VHFENTSSSNTFLDIKGSSANAYIRAYSDSNSVWLYQGGSNSYLQAQSGSTLRLGSGTANVVITDTSGEVMRTSSGNLLIGTTTDIGGKLTIQNDNSGSNSTGIYLKNTSAVNGGISIDFDNSSSNNVSARIASLRTSSTNFGTALTFSTAQSVAISEKMRLTSGGNLLLGTTTDSGAKLHVSDFSDVNIFIENTDTTVPSGQSYGGLIWKGNDNSGIGARNVGRIQLVSSGAVGDSDMLFFTADYNVSMAEKMRITSTGNVLIGTTTDSGEKLQVRDDTSSNNALIKLMQDGTGDACLGFNIVGSTQLRIGLDNDDGDSFKISRGSNLGSNTQLTIPSTGNLLIGTTTDDGYKLDVNGTQRVQDVLELDDVLTLNAISTPDDPDEGKSSIYMDSADGAIKVKINFEGEVVTRTIASFDG